MYVHNNNTIKYNFVNVPLGTVFANPVTYCMASVYYDGLYFVFKRNFLEIFVFISIYIFMVIVLLMKNPCNPLR